MWRFTQDFPTPFKTSNYYKFCTISHIFMTNTQMELKVLAYFEVPWICMRKIRKEGGLSIFLFCWRNSSLNLESQIQPSPVRFIVLIWWLQSYLAFPSKGFLIKQNKTFSPPPHRNHFHTVPEKTLEEKPNQQQTCNPTTKQQNVQKL